MALLYYENLSRTVLVGHGFGALLAGAVATRLPSRATRLPRRVARLVAVGCAVEPSARSYAQAMGPAFTALLYRQLGANGLAAPWSFDLLGIHCEEDRRWLAPRLTPAPFKLFLAEVPGLAENVPVTVVRCGRSHLPTAEPSVEARLLALATGHSPMVTAPRLLADLLMAEARADASPTHSLPTALGDPTALDAPRYRRHACGRHLRLVADTCLDASH